MDTKSFFSNWIVKNVLGAIAAVAAIVIAFSIRMSLMLTAFSLAYRAVPQ